MQQRTGQIDDRPAGGDHHDHEDERGLGEVAAFQIVQGMTCAAVRHQEDQQHGSPEAEHDLDLAQQVPEPRMVGLGMGQRLEVVCAEGVQERDREDRDGGNLDHSRGSAMRSSQLPAEDGRRKAATAIPAVCACGGAGVRAPE